MSFVFVLMWIINPAQFLTMTNFESMAFQLPELGLLSLGMMITMVSGGINLAIIASANLSGISSALVMTHLFTPQTGSVQVGLLIILAIVTGLLISLVTGLINGFLIAHVGVSPILATLGTMTFVNGINIVITKGYTISNFPNAIAFIGNGSIARIPMPLIIFIICTFIIAVILNKTALGFSIYMIGSNPVATYFSGINNRAVLMKTYALSGLLAGVASFIMISRFNSAKSGYGDAYLLITILAAVLGGTSTIGGFGKVSGLVLSLIILQIISSGLNLLGVSTFLTLSIWGITIILVMTANFFSERSMLKRTKMIKHEMSIR
jgi:simple sugar transport system permease protein